MKKRDRAKLLQEHEVYALVVKGTVDIQGLVALSRNNDFHAVYVAWMCTAPQNNKMLHPFQIAIYEDEATELRKVYDYEWTDEEI